MRTTIHRTADELAAAGPGATGRATARLSRHDTIQLALVTDDGRTWVEAWQAGRGGMTPLHTTGYLEDPTDTRAIRTAIDRAVARIRADRAAGLTPDQRAAAETADEWRRQHDLLETAIERRDAAMLAARRDGHGVVPIAAADGRTQQWISAACRQAGIIASDNPPNTATLDELERARRGLAAARPPETLARYELDDAIRRLADSGLSRSGIAGILGIAYALVETALAPPKPPRHDRRFRPAPRPR